MLKKFGFSFSIVGALIFSIVVVNNSLSSSAVAQHYQVLQPDGKDVAKDEGKKEGGKEGVKAEGQKEEKCEKCKHMPSQPEGDCRCDCHHRHQ